MEEEFLKYVSTYNMNDEKIQNKYIHSLRVMKLSNQYAKELGFSPEDIEIATIIGLLHDYGRFEQARLYHSFDDTKTIDHADFSVYQLFDKGEIKKYTTREDWYPIIKFAIKNHNKLAIEPCDDARMLMHAKLIRDTDKLDIIYLLGKLGEYNQQSDDSPLTKEVVETTLNRGQISKKNVITHNDHIIVKFSFIFDVNNDILLPKFKEYYKYFYERVEKDNKFSEIYKCINKYIDERIDRHDRNRN